MRIVPIDPPPPVRFEEFDGLTRILFQRRNKTVRANFQAKGVKDMLEANYKAWLSSRPQPLVRVQAGDHVLADDVMGEGNDGVALVLEQILQDSGFSDRRPAKMDVDDFLSLLARFHSHGFHFGG